MAEIVCKLVNVLREQLIRILDAVVDVGDFVKRNSIQVLAMSKLIQDKTNA